VLPAVLALLAGGCGGPDAVQVDPAAPPPAAKRVCAKLVAALPDHLDDAERRPTRPEGAPTAAWGDPPLVLRCGVAKPADLGPSSEILEVDDVEWFLAESAAGYTFTTVGRRAYVALTVPPSVRRADATAPLVDLAPAVSRHDPPRGGR